jgi:phosphoribosylaminoimidazolecarboxamide formyltransferase / IMP cyclohydrolase
VVIAPEVDEAAVAAAARKKNVRLLACGRRWPAARRGLEYKRVGGGLLVQSADELCLDEAALRVVTRRSPPRRRWPTCCSPGSVAWFVKSNAIVYARDGRPSASAPDR